MYVVFTGDVEHVNTDCILILLSDMPLAWEASLTNKERRAFDIIYDEARIQEEVYGKMAGLVLSSKAPGTITGYVAAISKWKSFADRNGFKHFPPDTQEFALYITNLSEQKTSYSSFKLLAAAMPFYYAAKNSREMCVTKIPFVKLVLDGAMRKASKQRGPVNKAKTFNEETIKSILRTTFWPSGSSDHPNKNLKEWRTAVRLYSYYMTLCRYDCYMKLNMSSFKFHQDHLVISFESRKNDQLYTGSTSVLKNRKDDLLCPRLIYQTYFRLMGFKDGTEILNCRLQINGARASPDKKLSYAQSLKDSRELLRKYGILEASEKSFKASGVTVLLDKRTSLTDVQVFGGWKSESTPLYYHNSSIARRMEISAKL